MTTATANRGTSARYGKRLVVNRFNLTMSPAAMAFGMAFLLWILTVLFMNGFSALAPSLFTEMTPPPQSETGGLAYAIFGPIAMAELATRPGPPLGTLDGISLTAYQPTGLTVRSTRYFNHLRLLEHSTATGPAPPCRRRPAGPGPTRR